MKPVKMVWLSFFLGTDADRACVRVPRAEREGEARGRRAAGREQRIEDEARAGITVSCRYLGARSHLLRKLPALPRVQLRAYGRCRVFLSYVLLVLLVARYLTSSENGPPFTVYHWVISFVQKAVWISSGIFKQRELHMYVRLSPVMPPTYSSPQDARGQRRSSDYLFFLAP